MPRCFHLTDDYIPWVDLFHRIIKMTNLINKKRIFIVVDEESNTIIAIFTNPTEADKHKAPGQTVFKRVVHENARGQGQFML